MHGLINRSIQCFVRDNYGAPAWTAVADAAGLDFDNFEPMISYPDALTEAVLTAAATRLGRPRDSLLEDIGTYLVSNSNVKVPRDSLLEDIGTYLVSNSNVKALRRLLRFGGVAYIDFLHSLDDLQGRGRLAVPDLDLPALELLDEGQDRYTLSCRATLPGFGHVVVGLLRAMADDYGALVILEHQGSRDGEERVSIELLDRSFAEGRRFELAALAG